MSHLARLIGAVERLERAAAALATAVLEGADARGQANAVRAALDKLKEAREDSGGHTRPISRAKEHGVHAS